MTELNRVLKNEITVHDKVGNTALRIFAPLVFGRELQRRLTNVDLTLDEPVSAQYGVIREMLTNLHEGRAIADVEPSIRYPDQHVDDDVSRRRARNETDNERRGHLTWAQLDRVIELFTVREKDEPTRPLRQRELDDMLDRPQESTEKQHEREPRRRMLRTSQSMPEVPRRYRLPPSRQSAENAKRRQ